MSNNKEIDTDKYKALFEYMKNAFSEELNRYTRLENKALKYLSTVSVAVAGFVFLLRSNASELIPPQNIEDCMILLFALVTFIALSYSWYNIFMSIKLQTLHKMPVCNETINLFKKHKIETVYLSLAKRYSEGTIKRGKEYDKKLLLVQKGFKGILFSVNSFVIFIILLVIREWIHN